MQINGQILSTCIEEDKPSDYGGHCQCQCNHDASSDSVSSSETYVEDTFFRENRCGAESGFDAGENWQSEVAREGGERQNKETTKNFLEEVTVAKTKEW